MKPPTLVVSFFYQSEIRRGIIMITKMLENVRKTTPLVHNITNYVTVNDCANAVIAIGGSPIMSDDIEDVRDITSICSALNINIGTLNKNTIPSMFEAGRISNELNHPVVLDPVGAGASMLRTETAKGLIDKVKFSVIRGNISEIKALALGNAKTLGVDAAVADKVTDDNIDNVIVFAKDFAKRTGATIAITGEIDIIADENIAYTATNGHSIMSKITGSGCMLSAILGAFISANPDNITEATLAAVCTMGICGERAFMRLKENDGNATFRTYLIDELYKIDENILGENARYEMR